MEIAAMKKVTKFNKCHRDIIKWRNAVFNEIYFTLTILCEGGMNCYKCIL